MTDATTKTERNSYPSMLELEARRCPELRPGVWEAAVERITAWGSKVGASVVHVVDPQTMVRLESIYIAK